MVKSASWEIVGKLVAPIFNFAAPFLKRWSKRVVFPSASQDKLSVLITRVSGDNSAQSNQLTIREAIRTTLPEVSVYAWPEELAFRDGEDLASLASARAQARKWLKAKRCDLLIAARMKSTNVIQLRFLSAQSTNSVGERAQTYALPVETMDLPANFTNDLAHALGACIVPYLTSKSRSPAHLSTLSRLIENLEKMLRGSDAITDARTRASILNSCSVARAIKFEFGGTPDDLTAAVDGLLRAGELLPREDFPTEWARYTTNYGAALVRLGGIRNDEKTLQNGVGALRQAVPQLKQLIPWSKAQLVLAGAYTELARVTGSEESLSDSIGVCLEVATPELLDAEPALWATAQDQLGRSLTSLGDRKPDNEVLLRSIQAFTDALEVWTDEFPEMRAGVLNNLSRPLIALGTRQSSADVFREAKLKLREAESLISMRHHLRLWTSIQINFGICSSLIGEIELSGLDRALRTLRDARASVPDLDEEMRGRATLALAKALLQSGRIRERPRELEECIGLLRALDVSEPDLKREAINNLGVAHYFLGKLTEDLPQLFEARKILSSLLKEYDQFAPQFAVYHTQQALGLTLREIGRLENSIELIDASVGLFTIGLAFASKESAPFFWATIQFHLAGSYYERAILDATHASIDKAIDHLDKAFSVLGAATTGSLTIQARQLADRVHELADASD